MARQRTPLAKAVATGRVDKDKTRFKDRKEPKSRPLGKPSKGLTDLELKAWKAFVSELSWLVEGDRAALEQASRARAKCWSDAEDDVFNVKHTTELRRWLSLLGATPADRSRVSVSEDDADESSESYFN